MIDIDKVLSQLGIRYSTREAGNRIAYVVECPYCTKHKHKDPSGAFFNSGKGISYKCWRSCQFGKTPQEVLSDISGASLKDVYAVLQEFSDAILKTPFKGSSVNAVPIPLSIPIDDIYRKYMSLRGLNIDYLKKYLIFTPHSKYLWDSGIQGNAKLDLSNRIIFPVFDRFRKLLTFTGRSIGKNSLRYIFPSGCSTNMKDTGWRFEKDPSGITVIVEGPFDALKLGRGAWASCGIAYTPGFVNTIVKNCKKVIVLFDPEVEAKKAENKLFNELSLLVDMKIVKYPYEHDIGDCGKEEVLWLRDLCGLSEMKEHLI